MTHAGPSLLLPSCAIRGTRSLGVQLSDPPQLCEHPLVRGGRHTPPAEGAGLPHGAAGGPGPGARNHPKVGSRLAASCSSRSHFRGLGARTPSCSTPDGGGAGLLPPGRPAEAGLPASPPPGAHWRRVPDALLGAGSHPGSEAAPGPAAARTAGARTCRLRGVRGAHGRRPPDPRRALHSEGGPGRACRLSTAVSLAPRAARPGCSRRPRPDRGAGRSPDPAGGAQKPPRPLGDRARAPRWRDALARRHRHRAPAGAQGAPAGTAQAGGRGQPRPEAAWGAAGYRP